MRTRGIEFVATHFSHGKQKKQTSQRECERERERENGERVRANVVRAAAVISVSSGIFKGP
jgi:hypothetical protein